MIDKYDIILKEYPDNLLPETNFFDKIVDRLKDDCFTPIDIKYKNYNLFGVVSYALSSSREINYNALINFLVGKGSGSYSYDGMEILLV